MSAKDADLQGNTVTFEITGGDPAKEYFQMNADTGQIAVKKSLQLDSQKRTEYIVSRTF